MVRNLAGQTFGRWTVLNNYRSDKSGISWLCRCQCGKERYVRAWALTRGESRSCGCGRVGPNRGDLAGQTFGELTVIEEARDKKSASVRWRCRCSCGREYITTATLLRTGRRTHCNDPIHRKSKPVALTGKRFGALTALFRVSRMDQDGNATWCCRCDCGQTVNVPQGDLMSRAATSCGCKELRSWCADGVAI